MRYSNGDLLGSTGIIVHGCNSLGVMGAGIALQIKNRYPEAYLVYMDECRRNGLKVGTNTYRIYNSGLVVVNAVTQEFIGRKPKVYVDYEAIGNCFRDLRNFIECRYSYGLYPSINIPKIGAGLGGGDWEKISMIIEQVLPSSVFDVVVWVR